MVLRLYFDAMSQPSRALLLFVRSASIPCQEVPIALRKGEHKSEEYRKINPFQRVPTIDHDGCRLTESVAILRYLCRTFPVPTHWYPEDSKKQARVDEYMAWQHLNLRTYGSMLVQTKLIIPRSTGNPPNEKRVAFYRDGLTNVLEQLESIWLKENPFIAGKDLTIADLLAVTELEHPGVVGYDVKVGRHNISSYMERVRTQLQPHYDEVHSMVYKVKDSQTKQ